MTSKRSETISFEDNEIYKEKQNPVSHKKDHQFVLMEEK